MELEKAIKKIKETHDDYLKDELDLAIETVLSELERLQKENEELREEKKNIEPVLINNKMYFIDGSLYEDLLNDIKSNYIPKQKLRDKMKEADKQII